MSLAGKLCIVTGASSGIGLATVRTLVREGAKVCATGRNLEALRQLESETGCGAVAADLTEPGVCSSVVASCVDKLGGKLTTLVNCAGILKGGAMGSDACNLDNYNANMDINSRVPFEMMVHAVPHLKAAGTEAGPAVVNVSSVNGKQSFAGCASYCMSKAAIDMLTRCAAVDLAPFGIRVNGVNPGVIMTQLQRRGGLDESQYAAFVERSVEVTHPLALARGKVGEPAEVADLIAFLVSDKANFITGECVAIDGGRQCLGAR